MAHAIAMPKPGQFTEECTVLKWNKKEGDPVAKGDVLFEIETDKSAMEVESFFEGTLLKIFVKEGGTVPVQTVVAYVGEAGEEVPTPPPPPKPEKAATAEAPAAAPPKAATAVAPARPATAPAATAAAPVAMPAAPAAPERLRISPRARRLARSAAIDPAPIPGTGPGGRIVERDVRGWMESKGYAQLRITPAAKNQAVAEGIDLLSLRGSGTSGRIVLEDIRRAIAERPKPMSRMRQTIARRLAESFATVPHFYITVPVDMTDLIELRAGLKARGLAYTVTDFILAAVVEALQAVPALNSSTDGVHLSEHQSVHLGLAVAIEGGLVVPVIRHADELTLEELHEQAAALAKKARAGKLTPDEMTGGTFTISNMGMLNVENFGAIINPGEAGILAVSSAMPQPVVRDGKVVARTIMKLTASVDHRVVDGATAAAFLHEIRTRLEERERWLGL